MRAQVQDTEVHFRVRLWKWTRQVRSWRGALYRRVLDVEGKPASLSALEQAQPVQLLSGVDGAWWRDHPAAWGREILAPEEPLRSAALADGKRLRFWEIEQNYEDAAKADLQDHLAQYLVIEDGLWKRTTAPGMTYFPQTNRVDVWLGGLEGPLSIGLDLDWGEAHRMVDVMVSQGYYPERIASYRYALLSLRGTGSIAPPGADIRMMQTVLRTFAKSAVPTIAALGAGAAKAYWSGRQLLKTGNDAQARNWLREHAEVLKRTRLRDVVQAVLAFEQRLSFVAPDLDHTLLASRWS
jgi:hypothetical protein